MTVSFGEQDLLELIFEIKKLRQVSTLQHCLEEFDIKLSKTNMNESQAIGHFLGGLKRKLKSL